MSRIGRHGRHGRFQRWGKGPFHPGPLKSPDQVIVVVGAEYEQGDTTDLYEQGDTTDAYEQGDA